MLPVVLTVVGEGGGWYAGQHVGHMLAELLLWDQPQGGGMVGRVNQGQVTHASSKVLRGKSCPRSGILASCVADSAQGFEAIKYPDR